VVILAVLLFPWPAEAGTLFLGAKGWYNWWDSGILGWLEKDIGTSFNKAGLDFMAESPVGRGFLIGPLLGYRFAGEKLSISLASMFISSFTQDWSGSGGTMVLKGVVDLRRQDYDLAISYVLGRHFRIYGGYKFQYMDLAFDLTFDPGTGTQTDTFEMKSSAHIPTIGLGAVYPLTSRLAVGAQAGVLSAFMNMKVTSPGGSTDEIWPRPGLGFNGELNFTYAPWQSFVLQLGYRYQAFVLRARGPGREDVETAYDVTHGPTLSLFYAF
jgi:hypothetical protein